MARITSEVAASKVGRYDLILIGARRARELNRGWRAKLDSKNSVVVTAIREIENGLIGRDYLLKKPYIDRRESIPESERR